MSGHHGRPGPRPRHTPHPAIRATVTAIILLAVGACTTPASTATPASPLATVSADSGGHTGTLTGVGSTVYRTPFSIGYLEQAYSKALLLPFAAIRNQAGQYVIPSAQSVAAAAAQKPDITPTGFSIVNQRGASSYPISGYSWALVYARQPAQATGQRLVSMLDWLTHDGQSFAAANGYVPLPSQIQQLARTMLRQVLGSGGKPLLG
jgi:hypothetical protein